MSKIRLSHSQREMYSLCARKYYYKYIKKMRPRAKGSALPFGSAFDDATDVLFKGETLQDAKDAFTDRWMPIEDNLDIKFSKSDFVEKILTEMDWKKLKSVVHLLNNSKPKQEYENGGTIEQLVKDFIKFWKSDFIRDLTPEEERFLHYAHVLCMLRKGHIMLDSFNNDIMPHVTKYHGSQVKISIKHPDGHEVMGYIDLLCEMAGYKLPSGRVLKENELVVVDVKSAGPTAWKKHDDMLKAPQLDTYLVSDQVQDLAIELNGEETNLMAYFVTSKTIRTNTEYHCKKCKNLKEGRHKTCNAVENGVRCEGEWEKSENHYVESKIVTTERNLDEARLVYSDFNCTLTGIQNNVFPRNRNSCNAFGGVCEYINICGKCFEDPEKEIEKWKEQYGE